MKENFLKVFFLFLFAVFLSGCATLSYVGPDANSENIQTIKTTEDFIFDTYKKSTANTNVKIGITRTPVPEILSILVMVENLSYETPYVFKVSDLGVFSPSEELKFITSTNYLSIYQTQEAASMTAMGAMGMTLQNMTGMNANYNEFNQSILQNSSNETNKSVFSKMEQLGNQILAHSIKISSTISPRKSQYFYFFIEDPKDYPIKITYKTLDYQFKL